MSDVHVEVEQPPPLTEDDDSGDSFMVSAWVHPPGSAPMVNASISLPADASIEDIATAFVRAITAVAHAHSSDLAMALEHQLFARGR